MARFLIGIDLGTTNSAVSFIDTAERLRGGRPTIRRFAIPQIVQPREIEARDTLPSFLYFPASDEPVAVTPDAEGGAVVGVYARDHGGLVPGRQVTSAKSWLCNPAVDRTAPILPWGHGEGDPGCSPVDASARYLAHMRDSWNRTHAEAGERFERQAIVITVPASFDEEARELTVEAARRAGLGHATLLEEPLAAFYAWIAAHGHSMARQIEDGDVILVCDVGGGTTDFTLIRASVSARAPALTAGTPESSAKGIPDGAATSAAGEVAFERIAVGEHLLLGGDNFDLALARRIESKLIGARLTLRQQQALARLTSAAKEQLFTSPADNRVTIAIPAAGRALIGGRLAADLTREEAIECLLDGFLPQVASGDVPLRSTRPGLREFGLPYAADPAITRHLAAFLARAASADGRGRDESGAPDAVPAGIPSRPPPALLRPDAVLFNGGFFTPDIAREAVVRAIESWFRPADSSWRLKVLANRQPATAIAVGAAYYAFAREHGGIRVAGGSARAYYVGLREGAETAGDRPIGDQEATAVTAVCVMPRGTDEGTSLPVRDRLFSVATNRPVAFSLHSAMTRHDALGAVVTLSPSEVHQHAPLVTILRYGKKSRQAELPVRLTARFTEVGTLEIWCESDVSEHRWRLQFELRSTETISARDVEHDAAASEEDEAREDEAAIVVPDDLVEEAIQALRGVFAAGESTEWTPETLVAQLEGLFGYARIAWPLTLIRRLADVLLELADGRKKGPRHEARWLNLAGFCLRPGFGATLDEWRMDQLRRIYPIGLSFPREIQNQAEWLVLWQRVAGGLSAGQQQEIYQRNRTVLGIGGRKEAKHVNPQIEREAWRLMASLERLPASNLASLGNQLLGRLEKQPDNAALLWALGRLGARIPAYGPINTVVPAATAGNWVDGLMAHGRRDAAGRKGDRGAQGDRNAAIAALVAMTGDGHRDIDDAERARALEYLRAHDASPDDLARVQRVVAPAPSDSQRVFGEALPEGLRLA